MKKPIVGLMAIALLACGQKSKELAFVGDSTRAANQEFINVSKDLYSDGRSKMIKTAECRFQVAEMKKSKEVIVSFVKKYSTYVESTNLEFQNRK